MEEDIIFMLYKDELKTLMNWGEFYVDVNELYDTEDINRKLLRRLGEIKNAIREQ